MDCFSKGMIPQGAENGCSCQIIMIKGNVIYKEENQQNELFLYDEQEI
jgi:hypothetical protein